MSDEHSSTRTIVVGVVADPGFPDKVVRAVIGEVEEQLNDQVSSSVRWDLDVRTDTLTLNDEGTLDLLDDAKPILEENGWDLLVCVTELPRRVQGQAVAFDLSTSRGVALVSIPGLGWTRIRTNVRVTLVHMIGRMAAPMIGVDPDLARTKPKGLAYRLQKFSPFHERSGDDQDIEAYLSLNGPTGATRLVLGMTRTNRPWRLLPGLSSAIAAAAGFASFGIFYSSIWSMADAASPQRLAAITALSIVAMVGWLIWHNSLWVPARGEDKREGAMSYNTSTILTLFIGVSFMYAVLFLLALVAAVVIIPTHHLESLLRHPVNVLDYVALVWLATSMGTVAGALGSSFESEDAVRRATYSKREVERRRRQARRDEEKEHVEAVHAHESDDGSTGEGGGPERAHGREAARPDREEAEGRPS